MAYERGLVVKWVQTAFNTFWSDECEVAFSRQPIGCYIAVRQSAIVGFCCLNVTYRNFIGPIGVDRNCRGQSIGKDLLMAAANELYRTGYAYAVVGDAGAPGFFSNAAGAVEIPDSSPGAYPRKI
jgi:ribosomal protein S18 acetylase RimI-like enzyme